MMYSSTYAYCILDYIQYCRVRSNLLTRVLEYLGTRVPDTRIDNIILAFLDLVVQLVLVYSLFQEPPSPRVRSGSLSAGVSPAAGVTERKIGVDGDAGV